MLIAVAVAVTIIALPAGPIAPTFGQGVLAGLAGSAASQGVGLATGLQSKLDFKGLALAGLTAGITAGVGPNGVFSSATSQTSLSGALGLGTIAGRAAEGLVGNALTQGIGVATGLQKRFDWTGVAAAGVAGGVSASIKLSSPIGKAVSGMAGGIAGAAATSLVTGNNFGDTLISQLPSIIGNTVGNVAADRIAAAGRSSNHMTPEERQAMANEVKNGSLITGDVRSSIDAAYVAFAGGSTTGVGDGTFPMAVAGAAGGDQFGGGSNWPTTVEWPDMVVTASAEQKLDNARISQVQYMNINNHFNAGGVFNADNTQDENATIHQMALQNMSPEAIYQNDLRTIYGTYTDTLIGFAAGEGIGFGISKAAPIVGSVLGKIGSRGAAESVWKLNPFQRGQQIEQALGHNLPSNFPTIDRFENGIATSIKSIDLDAASYLNGTTLNRALTGYVDKAATFNGRTWAGRTIESDDIFGRGLDLAIPHGGNASQQIIINNAIKYGSTRGVVVNPIIYP